MEEQCSPLNWAYCYQEEGIEEYLYSRVELEAAILTVHEEISRKEDEILQLKDLLANILRERDEFQAKCQALVSDNQQLLQQVAQMKTQQQSNCATSDDKNMSLSPSNCDDSTTWSPSKVVPSSSSSRDKCWPCEKPLPQNGKFLRAVMESGPLLHTLLLAVPLPRWQHPPPPLTPPTFHPPQSPPNTTSAEHSCLHHLPYVPVN